MSRHWYWLLNLVQQLLDKEHVKRCRVGRSMGIGEKGLWEGRR